MTAISSIISGYFILAVASLYWITAFAGWLGSWILPSSLIDSAPLFWMLIGTALTSALTQSVPGFFPDYSSLHDVGLEVALWLSIGLTARSYLAYIDYPDTFEELKASIASRPLERFLSTLLNHPTDAVFTRVWLANSILIIPLTVLMVLPSTINYFVLVSYSTLLLMGQFPQDVMDHQNIHTRLFQPKIGSTPRVKRFLGALQFYFEYVFAIVTARVPNFYKVQHVYVHHVEDNGPLDTQTTLGHDRTSFFDFARHSFWQGIDLVTGALTIPFLRMRGKTRQINELVRGFCAWYAVLLLIAVWNPLAAVYMFLSRFAGGHIVTITAFYQHGLVDPEEHDQVHGNTINYRGKEHGNVGGDFHVEHHQKPARHWSKYYEEQARAAAAVGGHPAIIVQKEQFGPLALVAALWRKDYDAIARHAHLDGVDDANTGELGRIVKERVGARGEYVRTGVLGTLDRRVSAVMAAALPKRFSV